VIHVGNAQDAAHLANELGMVDVRPFIDVIQKMEAERRPREIHLRINSLLGRFSGLDGTLCCRPVMRGEQLSFIERPLRLWLDYHKELRLASIVDTIGCQGQPEILRGLWGTQEVE
jgi:hypothetical protein